MHYTLMKQFLMVALAGGFFMTPALAEWQWIDKDGQKVFSDRAPPAEVLQKNILKQPGSRDRAAGQVAATAAQPAASAPAIRASAPAPLQKLGVPLIAGKDTELETRKKQAAELEKAQKQAEAERLAVAKADNCDRARKGQSSLQSGVRIAVTNSKGEREFMDDNARSSETRRLQAIADSDCVK